MMDDVNVICYIVSTTFNYNLKNIFCFFLCFSKGSRDYI